MFKKELHSIAGMYHIDDAISECEEEEHDLDLGNSRKWNFLSASDSNDSFSKFSAEN